MYVIAVTQRYQSIPGLLTELQEAWKHSETQQHAETTAYALADLSRRPRFAAEAVLPATLDFLQANGPHGVDGILLSALSAASVYDPPSFQRSIDKLILLSPTLNLDETKPEFRIGMVDFDAIRPTSLVDVDRSEPWRNVSAGDPLLSGLLESRFGARRDPVSLWKKHGAIGATIILNHLHSSASDDARKLIGDLKTMTDARQQVPGFGFTIRRAAGGLDEYTTPGLERTANEWKTFSKACSLGIDALSAGATVAGAISVTAKDPVSGFVGFALSGMAAEIARVKGAGDAAAREVEEALERLEQGTKKPDKEKKAKMPVPDDVGGGGRPTIFEVLEALKAYVARLDPYILPQEDDLGGDGVTLFKIPHSGDVDPLWEQVGGSMREDELRDWLAFLQAKLYDSLVNPTPE